MDKNWTIVNYKNKDTLPKTDDIVLAILQGCETKRLIPITLKKVDESDCEWRTADDNSEISYAFDVIKWMAIPKY